MIPYILALVLFVQIILTSTAQKNAVTLLNNPAAVTYSPDGSLFAITDAAVNQLVFLDGKISQINGKVLVYPTQSCGVRRKCKPLSIFGLLQPIETKFTPNNTCLFVAAYGQVAGLPGGVYAYRINPCSLDFALTLPGVFAPTSLAISPDGTLLAVAETSSPNGKILLYTIQDCQVINATTPASRNCFGVEFLKVAFSPDGSTLAVADISKNKVLLYPIQNGTFIAGKPSKISVSSPQSLAFSPDGTVLAIAEYQCKGDVIVAQVSEGIFTGEFQALSGHNFISSIAFSPDGKTLALVEFFKGRVLLYPIIGSNVSEKPRKIQFSCTSGISSLAFSPLTSCLAVAQENAHTVRFLRPF